MANITEKHEIRVSSDDFDFVFIADSDEGKLVIRQESKSGNDESSCSLTLKNPEELQDFFEGLRRVLTATGSIQTTPQEMRKAPSPTQQIVSGSSRRSDAERQQQIDRARNYNPNAFQPWTPEEEAEMIRSYQRGESPEAIGKRLKRSRRAIEMRLKKLGHLQD